MRADKDGRSRRRRSTSGDNTLSPLSSQKPFQSLKNTNYIIEPLSSEQIEAVHEASLKIISTQGIRVLSVSACEHLKAQGCMVDGDQMVRMDPAFVEEMIAKAPSSFTLTPRDPLKALHIGGAAMHFGLVSGPPNVHDGVRGRRPGTMEDFKDMIRLGQSFNCIHFMGNQTVATTDLPANTRHLDSMMQTLLLSDKVTSCMSIGAARVEDASRMIAIARGMSLDAMKDDPAAITNINVNSPRVLDQEMSDAALKLGELGQAVIITPFTLMGAMTPVTFAAALAQQNAEALFTIALIQSAYPGARVVYGGFTSNVDMKTGAPAFGTPENSRANMAGGQMARRYDLPYRTSACNAANCVDAQAAYETQMALWGAITGRGNLIYHAAGWLEGGLVASFEKLVIDAEMLQMMSCLLEQPDFSDDDFALEAMTDAGPGGHFFGTAHTLSRYKDAFYSPMISDWQNNENWADAGSLTATDRATVLWQDILKSFVPPPIDQAVVEELEAYTAHRKEQIGTGEP